MAPARGKVELEWETFTQLHHNMWILVTNLEQEITLKLLNYFGNEACPSSIWVSDDFFAVIMYVETAIKVT